jgi:hypothetical protein
MNFLIVNLAISTLIFYLAYRWLLKPVLHTISPAKVLTPILLLHAMRHLGLMFLTPAVVLSGMPPQFALPAAAGDFLSATLALVSAILIQRKSTYALTATWIFTVIGTLDFVMAIALSRIYSAGNYLGAAYWIPAFWVPMLAVGHGVIFQVLRSLKRSGKTLTA